MNSETPIFIALPQTSLLQLQGPDTNKFLQGQVTNDVNGCTPQTWQHNAHCTPKGRMVANFDTVRVDGETLLIRLPKDTQAPLQASLGKYIVFSKTKLADISDQYSCIGVQGKGSEDWLKQHLGLSFSAEQTVIQNSHGIFLKLNDDRVECWLLAETELPSPFADVSVSDDTSLWQLEDIQSGRGWVRESTVEEFLPQLLNLQAPTIDGVNFKKGCYTGQEIVARMHYKGKLKRHMYLLASNSSQEIAPGVDVYSGDKIRDGEKQSVGNVVNAVISEGRTYLLAVITQEAFEAGNLSLERDPSGSEDDLEPLPQPYSVE
ncbi:CAF17-like 4Fe-4S cluster assembly/insertion protein YgfZ [Pseudomaricurvus sp.]|uniref:CAF17-like 4Fe-4S cluster assembly/insertion protein YgfZ n=1 Tax=Pseudomaricurvus sp. TaxID=2004510 RepID=UPI003F6B34F4